MATEKKQSAYANGLTNQKFDSQYRLATIDDFKPNLTWYKRAGRADADDVFAQEVAPSGNLAADASRFQSAVNSNGAYLEGTSSSRKATKKAAPKKAAKKAAPKKAAKKAK